MVGRMRERGGHRAAVGCCSEVTGFAGAILRQPAVRLRAVDAFDPRSALVVVDVQNDFADPDGSLAVRGGAGIVPVVNAAVATAEAGGALGAYTQEWPPPHPPHFAPDAGILPGHFVPGTWGAGQ